ncbi:N-acetyltransferase [Mucilaginibacter sp. L3T2-6]|uniref:GNAT family N-acetyltransferase n=1 Tax=Mucilaginibacter sp. L3T2-6 TaxID=3062491 RepID=UPI0026775A33|nr:GNAT family N-acetyltransferase [Mucilaginibacter sp. L3T2-6]MDO3641716.1 GNAT family N-acetyltransferase [Mucilaginibacter sp. L3T2-6]MDV6214210.1 GNAT family N-acetyltransferase [Mucilaginibacter sp. L3T2-6]
MNIRRLGPNEAGIIAYLFDAYRQFYKQPSNLALAESYIKARLENNESVIFMATAEKDGKDVPAGFTQLYLRLSSVRASRNWLLNDLYVDAGFRRKGIGEGLIKAAVDFAKSENATFVVLETAKDNYTAQSLYEAMGFIKQEPTSDFFSYKIDL